MNESARRRLTVDEFYAWVSERQDGKYELVDGEPVMMAGANRRHDRIAANALWIFGNHSDGHQCQPFTSDTYIRIPSGNRRQADMGVDCGNPEDESLEADDPKFVLEILSPTTRAFDRNDKLEEYKTVESIEHILLVDPDYPQVRLYTRDASRAWTSRRVTGLDTVVEIPMFGMSLRLADLYARLDFRPQPMLVDLENPASKFMI
jgi:Uma2 family endonuclease